MEEEQDGRQEADVTKTEVLAKAQRRQHTAEYKLRILRESDVFKIREQLGLGKN